MHRRTSERVRSEKERGKRMDCYSSGKGLGMDLSICVHVFALMTTRVADYSTHINPCRDCSTRIRPCEYLHFLVSPCRVQASRNYRTRRQPCTLTEQTPPLLSIWRCNASSLSVLFQLLLPNVFLLLKE